MELLSSRLPTDLPFICILSLVGALLRAGGLFASEWCSIAIHPSFSIASGGVIFTLVPTQRVGVHSCLRFITLLVNVCEA